MNATVGHINFQLIEGYDFAGIKAVQSGPSYGYQSALTFATKNTHEEGVLERLRIDYNGNIGIGTATPQSLLHIKSLAPVLKLEGQGGLNATVGHINFQLAEGYDFASIKAVQSGPSYGYQSALIFGTKNLEADGVLERMRINYDGNVGIGTGTPTEKLSVNGTVKATKIKVSQSGWPDYVFKPDYVLHPLSEVSRFIKQNGHLPDIPSTKDVEENGVDLGDNQTLLLKKIEEMTLYMIDLEKRMLLLEQENKRLRLKRRS